MSDEKYDVLEKIGHGSFGIIRKVRRKTDGEVLCRKEINYLRMSTKEREQLHAEFAILSSLRHPNIVGYYHREHLKSTQDLHLYMEYCGNGDLGRVIKDLKTERKFAEEGFVWSMFAQLVSALYRCHYGVDPPEAGSNVMGLGHSAKPKSPAPGVMILHRDLKPENVFLGEHNSVKLGDFGLSKIMQSHDFASTYVGTPFYMSPEICAAEKYTLKSDIWALGCIMYELCSKEPPFNAKTHYDLVKRIKAGIINPLPSCYSLQLGDVIKSCLTVNPDRRPDTAALFDLPAIQMMRKEKEVVELSNMLKSKEALAMKRVQELEEQLRNVEVGKVQMHQEIEASLRREWEVKAQLEINRLVQIEMERLQKKYDQEVKEKVEFEVQKRLSTNSHSSAKDSTRSSSNSSLESDIARLSVGTNDDESGFHSSANLTDLSTSSPEPVKVTKKSGRTPFTRAQTMYTGSTGTPLDSDMADPSPVSTSSPEPVKVKKSARTPFGRAQTMFIGTPLDVEMADPSPVSIASLALSPRRNGATKAPTTGRNIFAAATTAGAESRWQSRSIESDGSDDDDELPPMPSPTRAKVTKNPFKSNGGRPPLISQKTAPVQKPVSQPNIFTAGKTALTSAPELRPQASNGSLRDRSPAPVRRLSKIPSSSNLNYENNLPQSPTRKLSMNKGKSGAEDLSKLVLKNNMAIKSSSASNLAPKGRTLVELAQARAGGRSLDGEGNRSPDSKGRAFAQRMADQGRCAEPPVWDPERDDMPSPFLNRNRAPRRL